MKASELLTQLGALVKSHGDCEVKVYETDGSSFSFEPAATVMLVQEASDGEGDPAVFSFNVVCQETYDMLQDDGQVTDEQATVRQ